MKSLIYCLLCTASLTAGAHAENWGQWRGPHFNGSTGESGLPVDFSMTENVVWSAKLPGASAATPAVWENKVFVSTTNAETGKLEAHCFDRLTGKSVWKHEIDQQISRDYRSTFAGPSPATNGDVVVFFYGSGQLLGFELDGRLLWERNIEKEYGPFAFMWTFSSSPLLYEGKLYLQVLQRDVPVSGRGLVGEKNVSYLLAMEPRTGKTLWRHVRPSEAKAESLEAFSTPVPYEHEGQKQLLIVGGDDLTAHDPATGDELWRWGTWNPSRIPHWRLVPSPVASPQTVLVCAPKKDPIYAIKTGGSGQLTDAAVAWTTEGNRDLTSDVPTPAYYDGDFFILSDLRRTLSRVEPATGRIKWTVETPGRTKYEASPLAADGKIYTINFAGEVAIFNAANGKLINQCVMAEGEDRVRSSIAAAHGQLFIRTNSTLYCVGR